MRVRPGVLNDRNLLFRKLSALRAEDLPTFDRPDECKFRTASQRILWRT